MQSFMAKYFLKDFSSFWAAQMILKIKYLRQTGFNYYYIDNLKIACNHETRFASNKRSNFCFLQKFWKK